MLKNNFLCMALAVMIYSYAGNAAGCDTSQINIRRDDKKQGVWETKCFLSKKSKSICEFEKGKRSGQYNKYYKSEFLKISREYSNNKKNGSECFYRDRVRNESIKRCVVYEKGKKRGTIKFLNTDM